MQFYEKRKLNDMKNAKDELIQRIGKANIVWAKMYYCQDIFYDEEREEGHDIVLAPNHTAEEEKAFFDKLNFSYDNGYGMQYLHGIVMLNDNSWLERREYDGSEWWEHCSVPQWIPTHKQ